jgi:hypothetical protein
MSEGERHRQAVGSLAQEAAKLAAVLQDLAESSAKTGSAEEEEIRWATGAPECSACPVCRVIAAARDLGPDFYTDLGAAVANLAAAISASAGGRQATPSPEGQDTEGEASGSEPPEPRKGPTVQRLDLEAYDE